MVVKSNKVSITVESNIKPQSVTLQQWVYQQTGYMPPEGQSQAVPGTCPSGYKLVVLGGAYTCCPDTSSTCSGVPLLPPTAPPDTFGAYSLYFPYQPNTGTLEDFISLTKYYTSGQYSSPYNSVCNIPYSWNEINVPQNVQKIYWAALQWGYNDANLCSNYTPPQPLTSSPP